MSNTRCTALLFMLSQVLQKTVCIPIDNSISEKPSIQCDPDSISIIFSTTKPFVGRTFVKGYIQDNNCIQIGNHHDQHKFTIKFNQCGLRRSREYSGIRITTTVIISFHPIFLTKVDRAYRLNCFYMESTKTITQQLEISMMTTEELYRQTQMPICRYEILDGSTTGVQVRYAKVGDSVYHRWTCVAETKGLYCMRVHTCTVSDGQGGEAVAVIDKKGCSVDKYLLVDLEYTDDLTAGQESHVFKFADRPALYFNCQLELTTKDYYRGCANERPVCKGQIRVKPAEQTYEQTTGTTEEETQTSVNEGNNKQHGYSSTADMDYRSNESPYQSNEVIYSSLPGPPAPPSRSADSSHFQSSPRSVHLADNNYEHTEEYGQLVARETTTFYEEAMAYKRLIRKKRNSTGQHFSSTSANILRPKLRIANVDLPEQCIMVFDLEDENNGEMQPGNFDRLLNTIKTSRTCFSTTRLTMLLAIAMITFALFAIALIVVLRKGRIVLLNDFIK
ncbi:Zona pellucida-like domain family protein [Acanthocheilonema viteae]